METRPPYTINTIHKYAGPQSGASPARANGLDLDTYPARHILDPRNFRSTLIRGLENIFTAVGGGHVSVSPFIRMGCQFDFITFTVIIGDPPAGAKVIFKKFFFPSRFGHQSVLSVGHSTRLYSFQ